MDSRERAARQRGPGPDAGFDGRVVGRDVELERIRLFLTGGYPATLVIEGEAGIGKSVLWEAAVNAAGESAPVLAWRASEAERSLGFAALSGLFDASLLAGWRERLAEPRRGALSVALGLAPGAGAPPEPALVGMAVADLLRAAAVEQPLVLAVDDVQWLDEASAGALAFAVRRLRSVPIGLVLAARTAQPGTSRPTSLALPDRSPLMDSMPHERRETIVVGPLSVGALGRLLRDRLGVSHPRPVLVRLHAAVDGNPFLAQEASRSLASRGLAPGPGDPLPISAEAGALVREHLATLGRHARRAVLLVAMSSEPTRRLVEGVLGEDADPAIDEAVASGVLVVDGPHLRAGHPLFTSTVHADAPPGERRALHRRLAELATRAGRPIEAAIHLGSSVDDRDQLVADSIQSGAEAALARGMPATAAELLERAAALTEDSDARAARAIAAAQHALAAGDAQRAERVLRRLLDEDAPRGSRQAEALAALGEIVYVRAPAEGLAILRSALEHVGEDRVLEALIHSYIVGNADPDLKHAIRSADRAVELLDTLQVEPRPNQLAAALLDRAFQWLLLGERVAKDDIDRGLALLDLSDNSFLARRAEESGERCLWLTGRLDEAMALDEEQYRWFSERGQLGLLPQLLQAMATMRLHTGRLDLAERHTREIEELVESGEELWRERGVMARVWIRAYAGELDAARALATAALARQEEEGDIWESVIYRSVLGFIELSVPEPAAAFEHLSRALEQNDAMSVGLPNVVAFLRDYVEAAILVGRRDLAEQATRRFEDVADRLGLPWEITMAARSRGLLASASDQVEDAIPCFDEALGLLEGRLPLPMDRGRVLLLRGEALRRLGRRREARASLDAASQVFESIGARAWLRRVANELARLGGRAPAGDALTVAERAVAELAASGLSNREIAARLVVSVRTIENQLSSVYGKLGVGSRRQLAGSIGAPAPDLSGSTDALLDGAS